MPTERLHADDGAEHVSIDVHVACARRLEDLPRKPVDPAVDAERQPKAAVVDRLQDGLDSARPVADHVQYRAEHLAFEEGTKCALSGKWRAAT